MLTFQERCKNIDDLYAEIESLKEQHKMLITPSFWSEFYFSEAVDCFENELFFSSVLVASALVESCLYWEWVRRKQPHFLPKITPSLSKLFRYFYDSDIPVHLLVDKEEPIEYYIKDKEIGKIRFIEVRNKFAHGDIRNINTFMPLSQTAVDEYGIDIGSPLESVAYIQVLKAFRFIIEFLKVYVKQLD
jgi:hypothetical protein